MRSFGEEFQQSPSAAEERTAGIAGSGNHAFLAGVVVSIRQNRHRDRCHDEGEDSGSIRASSVTEGDGGFSAVLALDRYYAPNKCPVLHVRVSRCSASVGTRGGFDDGHCEVSRILSGTFPLESDKRLLFYSYVELCVTSIQSPDVIVHLASASARPAKGDRMPLVQAKTPGELLLKRQTTSPLLLPTSVLTRFMSCPHLENEQVQVKRPHRSLSTAYHGAVPLSSSLSSAGTAVQETKGLMQEAEMQARAKETRAHTVPKKMASSFSGNVDDDRISMTETPLTSSESDYGSAHAVWARAKGNVHDKKTRDCCTVNVTTTFVPHMVRF